LIFDLRGDPGGLLDQGVSIADLFLDPGQRIVTLRGRTPEASRTYDDRLPQPWPHMPIALLVDSNSASAAEIVAGALQDHDRAIVLGTATYGKGSAQNVYPLPNGGAVKLTTARWYTPSGRSINRNRASSDGDDDNSATDASGAKRPRFTTDAGRTVLGGGGITPDILLPADSVPPGEVAFQHALGKQIPQFRSALTDYALSLKTTHAVTSPDFTVTPAMRAELQRRMQARGIVVDAPTMDGARSLIDRQLGYEIARDVFGTSAEFARRLRDDPAVARTVPIVAGAATQAELMRRAATSSDPRSSRPSAPQK
jgi:carboxyl-terminal processing protease